MSCAPALNERILELRGAPLPLLRGIAAQDPGVEDVRTFGDRLHLRLKEPHAASKSSSACKPQSPKAAVNSPMPAPSRPDWKMSSSPLPMPRNDMQQPAIQAQDLTRRFGDFVAVDHVSFHVLPGEIAGYLGPNGCGKTTTIRMLLGLLQPSEGRQACWASTSPANPSRSAPAAAICRKSSPFTTT